PPPPHTPDRRQRVPGRRRRGRLPAGPGADRRLAPAPGGAAPRGPRPPRGPHQSPPPHPPPGPPRGPPAPAGAHPRPGHQARPPRRSATPVPGLAPRAISRAPRSLTPSPYMSLLAAGGAWLAGASPERLVRLEHGRVDMRPLAGTRPRGATDAEDRALAAE